MNIVELILEEIKPELENKVFKYSSNESNFIFNDIECSPKTKKWMIENYRISLISDFLKAAGKYLLETDELLNLNSHFSKGALHVNVFLKRNETQYYWNTQLILAGGHNIQCLHYRYIIDTNLPKSNDNSIIQKSKNLCKKSKLEKNILDLEIHIENTNERINLLSTSDGRKNAYMKMLRLSSLPSYIDEEYLINYAEKQKNSYIYSINSQIKTLNKYKEKLNNI